MTEDLTNFQKVNTGNGYANDLTATTNDRLERTVKALVLLEKTSHAEGNTTRKSLLQLEESIENLQSVTISEGYQTRLTIDSLIETIKGLDEKNGRLQKTVLALTFVTVVLALVQIGVAIVQMRLQTFENKKTLPQDRTTFVIGGNYE